MQVLDITDPSAIKLRCTITFKHYDGPQCSHRDILQVCWVWSVMLSTFAIRIHEDPFTEREKISHYMWFYFRISGVRGTPLTMCIENAGNSTAFFNQTCRQPAMAGSRLVLQL